METWKRNLYILYAGQFLAMASTSCITPFLPLYLQELGLEGEREVSIWSGIIFSANLLTAAVFSIVWGRIGDRFGRKAMLIRAGIGMAATITLMGLVTSPVQLLLLRFVNGALSGFGPAAVALVAVGTPKERTGYALGLLHSGAVAGTLCGPLLGGILADWFGFRTVFSCFGLGILSATLIVIVWVRENFERKGWVEKTRLTQDVKTLMSRKPLSSLMVTVFFTRAAMVGTLPLIPLYVQQLAPDGENLALLAGLTTAAMGLANMIAAPQLGKLGDKFGSRYVLLASVFGAACLFIPHAFVQHLWQLIALRCCMGVFLGGIQPSINALVRHQAPEGMEGRAFSYFNSAMFLGGMAGASLLGLAASRFGIPSAFICSAVILSLSWIGMRRSGLRHAGSRMDKE